MHDMKYSETCRVCESGDDLKPLFDGDSNPIPSRLMSCANVQVSEKDGLPQNICNKCIALLDVSYTFKLQCEKVDSKLRAVVIASQVQNEKPNDDALSIEYPIASVIINDCKEDSFLEANEDNGLAKDIIHCNDDTSIDNEEAVVGNPKLRLRKLPFARERYRKEYACTACNEVFLCYSSWSKHRATHGAKRYLCRICNTLFSKKAYLDKHQKTHEDINDIQIHECQICFKKYTSKGNLQRHMRGHNGDLRHVCDVCGKRFIQSTTLRSHQLTHQDIRQFACKDCNKAFKSKQYLTHHREKMHSESNTNSLFCCEVCGRRFINERNLKWHIRNHVKPESKVENKAVKRPKRDYCCVCTYCGKTFKQKAQLHIHQRIHTGEKPYNCDTCNKRFRFQASYKFHLNSHTGERPFACNKCERRFKQPTHLRNHMQVHTGVKPHKCTFCDKSFASKSNMKVHTRIHTGERPYECNECGLGFLDSNGLKKHSKKHVV